MKVGGIMLLSIIVFLVVYTLFLSIQSLRVSGESFLGKCRDAKNKSIDEEGKNGQSIKVEGIIPWREIVIASVISAIVAIVYYLYSLKNLIIFPSLFFVLILVLILVLVMVKRDSTDGMLKAEKRNRKKKGKYRRDEENVPVYYYIKQGWRFIVLSCIFLCFLNLVALEWATQIKNPTCASIVKMTPTLLWIAAVFFVIVDVFFKYGRVNENHADSIRQESEDGGKERDELKRVIPGKRNEITNLERRKAELENKVISVDPTINTRIQSNKALIDSNDKRIEDLKSDDEKSREKTLKKYDKGIDALDNEIKVKTKELNTEKKARKYVSYSIVTLKAHGQNTATLSSEVSAADARIKVLEDEINDKKKEKSKIESRKAAVIKKADEKLEKLIQPLKDESLRLGDEINALSMSKKASSDEEAERERKLQEIEEKLKKAKEKVQEDEKRVKELDMGEVRSDERATAFEQKAVSFRVIAWTIIAIAALIAIWYVFSRVVWASSERVEEPKQVVVTTPVPEKPWYTFYNAELLTNDIKEDNFNFGVKLSGDDLKAEDYLRDFKERIKNDPALGAACIAWVDANMGTRYIGTFYEECQNNWAATMNAAKDSWIKDRTAYEKRLEVFFAYLNEAEVSIKDGKGIKDQMYMNPYTESEIPDIIVYETDQENGTFLVFTFAPKGSKTKKEVSFRVDCGYQPTNVEKIMDIKPQPKPNPKPSPTPTPKKKVNPPVVTEKPKDKTKGTSGGVVLPNDNPGPGPDTNNGVGAQYSSEQIENASIFETVKEYKEEIKELEKINETQRTDKDNSTPTIKTDKKTTAVDNNADKPNGYYDSINEPTEVKREARKARDGKSISNEPGEQWEGPSD